MSSSTYEKSLSPDIENQISYLSKFITDNRLDLFYKVLQDRTKYITVALEDIYQTQNTSAVLRSADCFGIQDVHIIENNNSYSINPDVAVGSNKWINIFKYNKLENNTLTAITKLKEDGYRIIATTPHSNNVNLENFNLSDGKIALFFGTELTGLSDTVIENADEFLKIPMYGFTESFNISVSASIILHQLTNKLHTSNLNWHITNTEKNTTMLKWLMNTIKKSELIVDDFISTQNTYNKPIKHDTKEG